jgi:opacity protein-like surface antigen
MWKVIVIAVVLATAAGDVLHAQIGFPQAVQLGAGVVIPIGDFADVAEPGSGFTVGTGVQLVPNVALYGGYTRIRFPSTAFGGDLTDSGFSVGISAILPQLGSPSMLPYAGIGVVFHQLRIDGAATQPRSDPGLGLGGGLLIPLTPRIRVSLPIGYVRYDAQTATGSLAVAYLSVGASLNVSAW